LAASCDGQAANTDSSLSRCRSGSTAAVIGEPSSWLNARMLPAIWL
jgi:hypothetical protein